MHNFEVENQGIEEKLEQPVQPGATQMLMVELKAGAHKIYYPIGNHEARGMEMALTVTP